MSTEEVDAKKNNIKSILEEAYKKSKGLHYKAEDWITEEWSQILQSKHDPNNISSVPVQRLKEVGEKISVLPEGANFHRLVKKIFEARH